MCAAEWRAWSLVSLGLATAAPDTLEPRPEVRERVLAAIAARPRATASAPARPAAMPTPVSAGPGQPPSRSGIAAGTRRLRGAPQAPATTAPTGPPFRWLLLGAAAAVVLFVAGAVLGQGFGVGTPETPRGDPGRVLAEAATILQGSGYTMARLQTPDGAPGGVVVVSPGSGRLAVVSGVLPEPPEGSRYICSLERDGVRTQVGYMRWEDTESGSLAYWAGQAEPPDLGLQGDRFVVTLGEEGTSPPPDTSPVLTGDFLG
jgi:hypothetical protein